MSVIIGILLNTLIVAGLIVWLSRGGSSWINTLNATSLASAVGVLVLVETAGAVLGMFIWAHLTGKQSQLDGSLAYLGIWFTFLGTYVLVNSSTQIGKRLTDGTYTEKKGEAKAKVEAAKASASHANGTPAVAVAHAEMVAATPSTTTEVAEEEHQWADRPPTAGLG